MKAGWITAHLVGKFHATRRVTISEERHSAQYKTADETTKIENRLSRRWAGLFNVRYRMLLTWLLHALTLTRRHPPPATAHLRGQIIHRVFGEMYNIKAIAEILVKLPLKEGQDRTERARVQSGPPLSRCPSA